MSIHCASQESLWVWWAQRSEAWSVVYSSQAFVWCPLSQCQLPASWGSLSSLGPSPVWHVVLLQSSKGEMLKEITVWELNFLKSLTKLHIFFNWKSDLRRNDEQRLLRKSRYSLTAGEMVWTYYQWNCICSSGIGTLSPQEAWDHWSRTPERGLGCDHGVQSSALWAPKFWNIVVPRGDRSHGTAPHWSDTLEVAVPIRVQNE